MTSKRSASETGNGCGGQVSLSYRSSAVQNSTWQRIVVVVVIMVIGGIGSVGN